MITRAILPAVLGIGLLVTAASRVSGAEFRALWADAFHNGFFTASQCQQLVDDARRGNFNAIIVQVRKRGDAFYTSSLEPKAVQVSPPSFDPLAELISLAHAGPEPLEVHAWLVAYNIWNRESSPPPQPDHPFRQHPEWLTRHHSTGGSWDGANHAFDPGHPGAQEHTFSVCMDLLDNYAIDGIHLDYIRYSEWGSSANYNPWGYNPVAVARFNAAHGRTGTPAPDDAEWLGFRRRQVTDLVRKVYLNAWARDPGVRVSAATITWSSPPSDPGAAAFASTTAYSRVLQDWRGWMEEGILDLNVAMNYRDQASLGVDFAIWCDRIRDTQFGRAAAVGLGSYLNTTGDTIGQIRTARAASPAGELAAGTAGYSYAVPNDDGVARPTFLDALTGASAFDPEPTPVFAEPVAPPAMPWKEDLSVGNAMGTLRVAATGAPADGATVVLAGPVTRVMTADATGFFGAVGLPTGTYTVRAGFGELAEISGQIEVVGAAVAEFDAAFFEVPFEVLSLRPNTLGGWELVWASRPGESYRLQISDDLSTWGDLAVGIASDGDTTSYDDFTAGGFPRRYYRVLREDP